MMPIAWELIIRTEAHPLCNVLRQRLYAQLIKLASGQTTAPNNMHDPRNPAAEDSASNNRQGDFVCDGFREAVSEKRRRLCAAVVANSRTAVLMHNSRSVCVTTTLIRLIVSKHNRNFVSKLSTA